MDLRIGLVGFGAAARRAALAWTCLPLACDESHARLVAVSVNDDREAEAARRSGFELVFTDPDDLIANAEVDALDVAAPLADRAGILRSAMAAGKHIFCDPLLAEDARDSAEIAALSARCPGMKQAGGFARHIPAVAWAKTHWSVDMGDLAHITLVVAIPSVGTPASGPLEEIGADALDLVTWLADDVSEVVAVLEPCTPDGRGSAGEGARAMLTFASGAAGSLILRRDPSISEPVFQFEATWACGAIRYDLDRPNTLQVRDETRAGWTEAPCAPPLGIGPIAFAQAASRAAFVRSIRQAAKPVPSFHDALRLQAIVGALNASIDEGAWRKVEL
ncbi:MAG TPA: Gfo/Idh/MocA family oxidoreductase [Armatimonadota bacterium]